MITWLGILDNTAQQFLKKEGFPWSNGINIKEVKGYD